MEAERLLKMIRSAEGSTRTLCVVDELLSGTNSAERLAASSEILRYLIGHHALVIASTHDLELAEMLQDHYQCFNFAGRVDDNGIRFDYQLRDGITSDRNAITLLEYLGYPKEIVEAARTSVLRHTGPSRPVP